MGIERVTCIVPLHAFAFGEWATAAEYFPYAFVVIRRTLKALIDGMPFVAFEGRAQNARFPAMFKTMQIWVLGEFDYETHTFDRWNRSVLSNSGGRDG